MTVYAHAPFDTPGRPKCHGEKDGIHLYKLNSHACHYCGLLDSYTGIDGPEFSDDELRGDSDEPG